MSYHLFYHPLVLKEDLPPLNKDIKARIKSGIENRLLKEPALYGKPLRYSLKSLWSLRIGDYRVVYKIEKIEITILKIGHRKEAYNNLFTRASLS
ncbi:MAG: type II toxin-antitoxin system RelE/ParE family toxin [Nitrospirota bacterium]